MRRSDTEAARKEKSSSVKTCFPKCLVFKVTHRLPSSITHFLLLMTQRPCDNVGGLRFIRQKQVPHMNQVMTWVWACIFHVVLWLIKSVAAAEITVEPVRFRRSPVTKFPDVLNWPRLVAGGGGGSCSTSLVIQGIDQPCFWRMHDAGEY